MEEIGGEPGAGVGGGEGEVIADGEGEGESEREKEDVEGIGEGGGEAGLPQGEGAGVGTRGTGGSWGGARESLGVYRSSAWEGLSEFFGGREVGKGCCVGSGGGNVHAGLREADVDWGIRRITGWASRPYEVNRRVDCKF